MMKRKKVEGRDSERERETDWHCSSAAASLTDRQPYTD